MRYEFNIGLINVGPWWLIKRKGKEMQVFFSQSYKHVITFQKILNSKYWSLIFEIC